MQNVTSSKRLFAAVLGGLAALSLGSMGRAATLVNDTWLDGTDSDPAVPTYSENGTDTDLDGDKESAWFRGGSGSTLDPVGPGGPLRGGVATSSASFTTYFTPEGSEVTLADTGSQLKVTWVFTMTGVNATNSSQAMHIGLANSDADDRIIADGNSPGSPGAFAGYALWMNMGQTLGNGNSFQLRGRTNAANTFLNSTGDWSEILGNEGISGDVGYADATQYTLTMTLTRNASSGLDIVASMSGGNLTGDGLLQVIATDAAPQSFSYDIFGWRPSNAAGTATTFDTSLFKVEYVPEPVSLAMLGLCGLGLARRRH